jgi:uncharacterized protein (UPF0218 family)
VQAEHVTSDVVGREQTEHIVTVHLITAVKMKREKHDAENVVVIGNMDLIVLIAITVL